MSRYVKLSGFAAALLVAALFGSFISQTVGTAEAQTARTTTLGAVEREREAIEAEREAARQAALQAHNAIVSAGCEFHPDPDVVVPPQLHRPSSGYFWVATDCLRQIKGYADVCEPVRPGNASEGRAGSVLVTAECEIPAPAPRAEMPPQAIECSTRAACEVEVTFRDDAGREVIRTMKVTFDE